MIRKRNCALLVQVPCLIETHNPLHIPLGCIYCLRPCSSQHYLQCEAHLYVSYVTKICAENLRKSASCGRQVCRIDMRRVFKAPKLLTLHNGSLKANNTRWWSGAATASIVSSRSQAACGSEFATCVPMNRDACVHSHHPLTTPVRKLC